MKFVMHYELAPGGLEKARHYGLEHKARLAEFHAKGTLLMAGPLMDQQGGALGIFTSRAAAEEFIAGDPFVQYGVVSKWTVREWNEILAPPKP